MYHSNFDKKKNSKQTFKYIQILALEKIKHKIWLKSSDY